MNITSLRQRTGACSPRSVLLWHLSLAGILLFLYFGVVLLRPNAMDETGKKFRRPAGQFQANARTLFATVRYLLTPESDIEIAPAAIGSSTAALTIQASGRPFETFAYSSNQTEMPSALSTNWPARS